MDLSYKLKAILSLTGVKNNELAQAVNVDSAQISRLRTGARKNPRDPGLMRSISDYLASRVDSDYMLSALYDLTRDSRVKSNSDSRKLSDIINEWLSDNKATPVIEFESFLNTLNDYSGAHSVRAAPTNQPKYDEIHLLEANFCRIYSGNEGKRQATLDLCDCLLSLDETCTVKIFSDETDDWLIEKEEFLRILTQRISLIAAKDVKTLRIFPPSRNIESAFRDIERWMPEYVAGTIRLYRYPWARDELHRMTLIIVPGKMVLYSMSIGGQREARMTVLNTDPRSVEERDKYFDSILEHCNAMVNVCTYNDGAKALKTIQSISQCVDDGIHKACFLSAHTLPAAVISSAKKRATPYVARVLECYAKTEQFKFNVLQSNKITDIMSLPETERVLAGAEPLPGTSAGKDTLYYTPDEYRQHLEHIIWYLETYPNYRAVLLDRHEMKDLVIYTKGHNKALLIKETNPFALFNIIEPRLVEAFVTYLRNVAVKKMNEHSRQDTLDKLKNERDLLTALLNKDSD